MAAAPVTQAWLAVGDGSAADATGRYFYRLREKSPEPGTRRVALQEALLDRCAALSGVSLT